MDSAERTIRKEPSGGNGVVPLKRDGGENALSQEKPAEKERLRISEAGPQPLRPVTQARELAKRPEAIAKPASTTAHKALLVARAVLPLVQKALPLLDGNVAAVVANLLAPTLAGPPAALKPLEATVARLRADYAGLQTRVDEQAAGLKRMEEQVEAAKDAAERSALEAKELAGEVEALRRRFTRFARVGAALLVLLLAGNVLLLLWFAGILR